MSLGPIGRRKDSDSRLAARYIDEKIVLSETHAWSYFRCPLVPYEFLPANSRTSILVHIVESLAGLVTGSEPVDCHLRVTHTPILSADWAADMDHRAKNHAPGWPDFLDQQVDEIENGNFLSTEVYLGVCLGPRKGRGSAKASKGGILSQFEGMFVKAEKSMGLDDDYVPADEIDYWHGKADDIARNLAGSHMKAAPAGAAAVARLIRQPMHPNLPVPVGVGDGRPWGPGETHELAEGHVVNGRHHLEITQPSGTGVTATFALARFPDVLHFPEREPWIHVAAALPFPVEFSSRFSVVPPQKVQKDVQRALDAANDQDKHMREAGANPTMQLQEQLSRALALEFSIGKDRMPFIYGRHRITVTAADKDELDAQFITLRNHYRELQIEVVWPSGDQLDLLCESQPGDRIRGKAYHQRQELSVLAGGMPTASAEVGDRVGPDGKGFIGPIIAETTSRVRTPVHYSPLAGPARDITGGTAITGAPGNGKSYLAFKLTHQMALQGVWTVFIDPKDDAAPLAALPGMGDARVLNLAHGASGILDPFSLGEGEQVLLAIETLSLLLGGKLTSAREQALFLAVKTVAARPNPSLNAVVDLLLASTGDPEANNLGQVLDVIRNLQFARLCFASGNGMITRPEGRLTIISLLGLELPDAETPRDGYGYGDRLAVAVMFLVTRYARRLMLSIDKNQPKAIVIDEAWMVTATPQGAKLIPEVARMGRSHNTGLVVISQNAGDLSAVANHMSTVFAFQSKSTNEITNVLGALGMEDVPENHSEIRQLGNGECLMRDADGRIARIQILRGTSAQFSAFNTNPETRGKEVA